MGFSKKEYWSGLLSPPSGDLPNSGIEPASPMSLALAGRFFTTSATWEAPYASVANENENEKELGQMYPVTLDSC